MSCDPPSAAWLEDESGKRIDLKNHFTVGRAPANSLTLKDSEQRVSAYHARIECRAEGSYFLEDRHSTNGTFINGRKITREELCDGDRVRFGSPAVFRFRGPQHGQLPVENLVGYATTKRNYEERECWFLIGDIKDSSRLAVSLDGISLARLFADWAERCRKVAEGCGGVMANRTGDGWLVLWNDGPAAPKMISATLRTLRDLQRAAAPGFRVLVHRGRATISGAVLAGEDSVSSLELHQAFRMEKIAARLKQDMLVSEAAAERLQPVLPCRALPGVFELPGFTGSYRFFEVVAEEEATRRAGL